jgi:curved DNA-binding protein CbpA
MRRAKKSYHEVLGVAPDAQPGEVKRAYRILAKRLHPDRLSDPDRARDSEEKLKEINAAWNEFRVLLKGGTVRKRTSESGRDSAPSSAHRAEPADDRAYEVPLWRRRGSTGSTRDRYRAERVRASRGREEREREAREAAEAVRRERDDEVRQRVEQDRARAVGILLLVGGLVAACIALVVIVLLIAIAAS